MKNFLTLKKALIFVVLTVIFFIIADKTGNEKLSTIAGMIFLSSIIVLLVASLSERKGIKARDQERLAKKSSNPAFIQNEKNELNKVSKYYKIILLLMVVGIFLSPILKNTSLGFVLGYGTMLAGGFVAAITLRRWAEGKPINKIVLVIDIILILVLLVLNAIYYPDQLTSYLEARR